MSSVLKCWWDGEKCSLVSFSVRSGGHDFCMIEKPLGQPKAGGGSDLLSPLMEPLVSQEMAATVAVAD